MISQRIKDRSLEQKGEILDELIKMVENEKAAASTPQGPKIAAIVSTFIESAAFIHENLGKLTAHFKVE